MKKFLETASKKNDAKIIVFSVALGKNWKESVSAIRKTSFFVETFDESGKNLLENVKIWDDGNLKLKYLDQIFEKTSKIRSMGKIPFLISRCHLPTLYALGAYNEKLHLIVFDAHLDLKEKYLDEKMKEMNFCETKEVPTEELNDATWLRRFVEYSYNKNILIICPRSFDDEEINFAMKNGIKILSAKEIKENLEKAKETVKNFSSQREIYVSLDIDVFDPSIAPAIDHPEPNGLNFHEFCEIVGAISGKIVGLDLCCLKKMEENEITEFLAVKSIFRILNKIQNSKII